MCGIGGLFYRGPGPADCDGAVGTMTDDIGHGKPGGRIGVLHVISGLGLGGAERMLLWSARSHDRERFRMGVVSLMSGGDLADDIRRAGVDVFELGANRGRFSLGAFRRLMGIIDGFRPRILQGHMFHSNIIVRAAGLLRPGTAVLSTRHIDTSTPARRFANRATGFLNSSTLVFSPKVLDEEKRENLFGRPIRLVRYGVEMPDKRDRAGEAAMESPARLKREMGVLQGAFVWIAAGRATRQKGLTDLIDAFSVIPEESGGPVLLIAGGGEDLERLKEHASRSEASERIVFTGALKDVRPCFAFSDAFVLSSLWEGGPLVVLEAMAAGLPVVSTRVGDTPSMVLDGETGILVDPGDAGQLARAMITVQGLGPEAAQWGLKGRRRVEELYDFRRTQAEMEAYYAELARAVRPGHLEE